MRHGTRYAHDHQKCRCDECRAWARAREAKKRESRAVRGRPMTPQEVEALQDEQKAARSDDVSYVWSHQRMRKERGYASRHTCVACGGQAIQWAYKGGSPKERTDTLIVRGKPREVKYSPDPDDYQPMCVPCHLEFDRR